MPADQRLDKSTERWSSGKPGEWWINCSIIVFSAYSVLGQLFLSGLIYQGNEYSDKEIKDIDGEYSHIQY